jgi:hypothetical protein
MYGIRSQILAISLLAGLAPVQTCWAQSQLPERGLDKSTVETRLGAPQRVEGPVGEPPITKWIYADFIVVFEYDHVVHTVKRQPAVEMAPEAESFTPANNTPPTTGATESAGPAPAPAPAGESTATQTTGDTLSIPQ